MAVEKAHRFQPREHKWIQRPLLERLVALGEKAQGVMAAYAKLQVFTYAFLLRMPSEAIVAVAGRKGMQCQSNSMVYMDGHELVVELHRRKNKPRGSILRRCCTCAASKALCVVHTVAPLLERCELGERVFPLCTIRNAPDVLRMMLRALNVADAEGYRCHDFRRGHAQDLADSGAPLHEILGAGEWTSPAFLKYLDLHKLEAKMVVQSVLGESDGEE